MCSHQESEDEKSFLVSSVLLLKEVLLYKTLGCSPTRKDLKNYGIFSILNFLANHEGLMFKGGHGSKKHKKVIHQCFYD